MGLANVSNGRLLASAAVELFDFLITVDKNLHKQQNIRARAINAISILADDIDPDSLRPFAEIVLGILRDHPAGTIAHYLIHADGSIEVIKP